MKHAIISRSLSALALAALMAMTGCGGDDNPTNSTPNGSMSAKVSGDSWSATNIQSTWSSGVLGIGGSQISGMNNKQFNIAGLVSKAGTYNLNPFSGLTFTYAEAAGTSVKTFIAQSGTLTVDELTTSGAKGSFTAEVKEQDASGAGTATRSITEGKFDVKF